MTNGHVQLTQTAVNVPDGNRRYPSGGTSSFNREYTHEELNNVGTSPRPVDAGYAGHSPSPLPISPANAASVGITPPLGGPSATSRSPAFSDLELARVMVDRASDYNLQGKAKAMKYAMRAAAALLLAGASAVGWQPVIDGYIDGAQCAQGSGCLAHIPANLLECLKCCSLNCNYSGFLQGCQQACTSGAEPSTDSESVPARIVELVVSEVEKIQSGTLSQVQLASSIDFVVTAAKDKDPHIAMCSRALGEQLPIVRSLIHNEGGDI